MIAALFLLCVALVTALLYMGLTGQSLDGGDGLDIIVRDSSHSSIGQSTLRDNLGISESQSQSDWNNVVDVRMESRTTELSMPSRQARVAVLQTWMTYADAGVPDPRNEELSHFDRLRWRIQCYCEAHGYTYIFEHVQGMANLSRDSVLKKAADPRVLRMDYIEQILSPPNEFDILMYVDTDATINDASVRIEEFLAAVEKRRAPYLDNGQCVVTGQSQKKANPVMNSGVLIFRRDPRLATYMQEWRRALVEIGTAYSSDQTPLNVALLRLALRASNSPLNDTASADAACIQHLYDSNATIVPQLRAFAACLVDTMSTAVSTPPDNKWNLSNGAQCWLPCVGIVDSEQLNTKDCDHAPSQLITFPHTFVLHDNRWKGKMQQWPFQLPATKEDVCLELRRQLGK